MPLSFTGPDSFYSAGEDAWWAAVDQALKGAPRQKLFGLTDDGLQIAPLYARRSDTPARALRTAEEGWSVVQRIDIPDPSHANAQILEDLEGGASGLELVFSDAPTAGDGGIRVADLSGMETLLQGVKPDLIDIRLEAGRGAPEKARLDAGTSGKRENSTRPR
ncbi:methylmalonyl-CoA mutase family protein [Roseibium salinum]|nr:methylmalonyl-CoA mutase family protein [Roseibium salinum]